MTLDIYGAVQSGVSPAVRDALATIRESFPEAVIAGGWLRDIVAGVAPTDVDVFCGPHTEAMCQSTLARACMVMPTDPVRLGQCVGDVGEAYLLWSRSDISSVHEAVSQHGFKVQLISINRPITSHSILRRMDMDFCQIAFDGSNVVWTSGFERAMREKVVRYTGPGDAEALSRTYQRVGRFLQRYVPDDWRFELPQLPDPYGMPF